MNFKEIMEGLLTGKDWNELISLTKNIAGNSGYWSSAFYSRLDKLKR